MKQNKQNEKEVKNPSENSQEQNDAIQKAQVGQLDQSLPQQEGQKEESDYDRREREKRYFLRNADTNAERRTAQSDPKMLYEVNNLVVDLEKFLGSLKRFQVNFKE
jgi:hypothetical protein